MMVVGIHGFCSYISGLPPSVLTIQASRLLLSGFPGLVGVVGWWGGGKFLRATGTHP